MQAARVSAACRTLKQTAAIIRERPFQYAKVPQLDLDSFVIYTSAVHLRVSVQCGTDSLIQSTSNCSVMRTLWLGCAHLMNEHCTERVNVFGMLVTSTQLSLKYNNLPLMSPPHPHFFT